MPKTVEIQVYQFEELNPKAKERARNWFRESIQQNDWWGEVYEDAKQCAVRLGVDIDKIYFTGFASQGDGACFTGTWQHSAKPEGFTTFLEAIKDHAPKDYLLHDIAARLDAMEGMSTKVTHSGLYYHEYSSNFEVDLLLVDEKIQSEKESELGSILRNFMRWIYSQLGKENDYLCSDTYVDETIIANEYDFTKDGRRYIE
jgi:hypothetical protein